MRSSAPIWAAGWLGALVTGTALTLQSLGPLPEGALVVELLIRLELLALAIGAAITLVGFIVASRASAIVGAAERGLGATAGLLAAVFLLPGPLAAGLTPGLQHPQVFSAAVDAALLPSVLVGVLWLPVHVRRAAHVPRAEIRDPQWSSANGALQLVLDDATGDSVDAAKSPEPKS
jgi:hypothetical protein